jgi:hypothetical protein
VISGHHDWLNVFQQWEEILIEEIIADVTVINAITAIQGATNRQERVGALGQLMERLG